MLTFFGFKRFSIGLRRSSRLFASQADGLGSLVGSRDPYQEEDDAGAANALGGIYTRRRLLFKPWQKAAIAVGSAVGALLDPSRADLVAALGETTGTLAFRNMLTRMKDSPEGRCCQVRPYRTPKGGWSGTVRFQPYRTSVVRKKNKRTCFFSYRTVPCGTVLARIFEQRILARRPRVTSASVGHAWDLPDNTFGAAYAKFMGKRNFSPDDRPPVRFMDSDELAYVATRAREVHDFWHVLFKLPTNLIGESALKMLEFQQIYLPMCFLSVVGGTIRLKPSQRDLLIWECLPWAIKAGRNCSDLMCIYYEDHFHEDLDEVRNKWGILPAPSFHGSKTVQ